MKTLVLTIAALVLGGCAMSGGDAPSPAQPQRCDAAASQSLVGAHVGAVTFPAGANVRIACTTCPVTQDLQPDRLNLRFNQATGVIERVTCG